MHNETLRSFEDVRFLSQVVCEIPGDEYQPGFRWYEKEARSCSRPDWMAPTSRLIATSASQNSEEALQEVESAIAQSATFIAFEFLHADHARRLLNLVTSAGAEPLIFMHLSQPPPGPAVLVERFMDMAKVGAQCMKIAYPASSAADVGNGLVALSLVREITDLRVCITPMGLRWGRIAAAAAGSDLVFAPAKSIGDRPSATEMIEILKMTSDPGLPKDNGAVVCP